MKTAIHTVLVLFRIAASYLSLFLFVCEWIRFEHGYVQGSFDFALSVLFCLFWVAGIFPNAKLMLRSRGCRRGLVVLLASGLALHLFRYLLPIRYEQLLYIGGKTSEYLMDVSDMQNSINIWSEENCFLVLMGFVPPLVCWLAYLWMRHCKKAPPEPPPVPST